MVKMNLGEVQTQTADIKSYCTSLKEGVENLNTVASGLGLEVGISGTTGNSIKSYISSMYPALAKTMVMHAESVEEANQAYVDGYVSTCGGNSLDSEVLENQISQYDSVISSLETSKTSQETWYRGLDTKMQQLIRYDYQETIRNLTSSISTNESERKVLQEKLEKLLTFNGQSPSYFSDAEESKNLMNEGLQLLGGDPSTGKIGAGSWNGHGFTKIESDWQNRVNEKWNEKEIEFKKNLMNEYGFSEEEADLIYKIYKNLMDKEGAEGKKVFWQLIASPVYNGFAWNYVFGSANEEAVRKLLKSLGISDKGASAFISMLQNQNGMSSSSALTVEEYYNSLDKAKLTAWKDLEQSEKDRISNMWNRYNNKTDFSHLAAIIASYQNNSSFEDEAGTIIGAIFGIEGLDENAGYIGDAVGTNGVAPSMGPDDYKADLDAVNIFNRLKNDDIINAINNYNYDISSGKTNRAEEFIKNIGNGDYGEGIVKLQGDYNTFINSPKYNKLSKEEQKVFASFILNLINGNNEMR